MDAGETKTFVVARCLKCGGRALVSLRRWLGRRRACEVCGGPLAYEREAGHADFRPKGVGA